MGLSLVGKSLNLSAENESGNKATPPGPDSTERAGLIVLKRVGFNQRCYLSVAFQEFHLVS
jgi:hypothetical protein